MLTVKFGDFDQASRARKGKKSRVRREASKLISRVSRATYASSDVTRGVCVGGESERCAQRGWCVSLLDELAAASGGEAATTHVLYRRI